LNDRTCIEVRTQVREPFSREDIKEIFAQFGQVYYVRGEHPRFFVEFYHETDAQTAITNQKFVSFGEKNYSFEISLYRKVKRKFEEPDQGNSFKRQKKEKLSESNTILVTLTIPIEPTPNQIYHYFRDCQPESYYIRRDNNRRFKGSFYVKFYSVEGRSKSLEIKSYFFG